MIATFMSSNIIEKLTLYSVLPFQVLLSKFDSGLIAEPSDKNTLYKLWEKTSRAYTGIGPGSRSLLGNGDIREIDDIPKSKKESLINRILLYPSFESKTNIFYVRISKIVTPQVVINLLRAQQWSKIKKGMSAEELCDLMLEVRDCSVGINQQILAERSNGGSMLFTSFNEDMRFHHLPIYQKSALNGNDPTGPMVDGVCFKIGGGVSFASAYNVQIEAGKSRIIVTNGIHRIYKLAEQGYEWCPLAVTDIAPSELPDSLVQISNNTLLNPDSNPPVISDFLKKDITIPLGFFRLLTTIRLNWNFEQYDAIIK
jgi:hypothetical protein